MPCYFGRGFIQWVGPEECKVGDGGATQVMKSRKNRNTSPEREFGNCAGKTPFLIAKLLRDAAFGTIPGENTGVETPKSEKNGCSNVIENVETGKMLPSRGFLKWSAACCFLARVLFTTFRLDFFVGKIMRSCALFAKNLKCEFDRLRSLVLTTGPSIEETD